MKGLVKKKAQLGAKENEFEDPLPGQWGSITGSKPKRAAEVPSRPAKAALQTDSPAHTAPTCSETVHLVAP